MRRLLVWGLALVGGLLFWIWVRGGFLGSGLRNPQELLPAPQRLPASEILIQDLAGTTASIPGQIKGPALIVFWASW